MKLTVTLMLALMVASTGPAWAGDASAAKPKATTSAGAPAAAPAAPGAVAAPAAATIDWKGMSKKKRKDYMKKTVLPAMQKVFAEFDAKKYKKITCQTCHGNDAAERKYEMPNPHLPKLPTEMAGFKALQEKKPDMMKFMGEKVKPTMAHLLGQPEMTQDNPTGFGCFACHTKEPAAAAPAK